MKKPSIKSIRRYLLTSLIVALTCGFILVAIFTYFNAAGEIDELYDKNMVEVADALKSQIEGLNLDDYQIKGAVGASLEDRIKEEQELLVQVWNKHRESIYTSHRNIPYPFQEKRGLAAFEFNGKMWSTYSTETDNFVIQVSQPLKARARYVREISIHLLIPLLSLIPIVGLFVWLAVGKSLSPLNDISRAITKRSATSLEPISEDNIPLEIQPLTQELNELLVRLSAALEAQRSFTADAAHQLRTPLTVLQLQLDNLKRAKTDEQRAHTASRLQGGIDRATHLVQQLLTLARVEPNAAETHVASVNLLELLNELLKQHAELAIQKNIDFGIGLGKPVNVTGNAENLQVLFENLISNALRYTPQGGRVNVNIYTDIANAIVEVQDDGIGIPKDERERIFERFSRVLGTEVEGTGLGLSIAKNIVEQHGGTISVSDGIEGKGAGFTVKFPYSKKPD